MNRKKIFKYLLFLFNFFISLLITLLLLNYFLSFYYDDGVKLKRYISKNNLDYDERSKKQVYKDLKNSGKDPTIVFYPVYNTKVDYYADRLQINKEKINLLNSKDLFTLSGISKKLTILCREQLNYAFYNSDRYGFNNPDKVWDEESVEYVFLGDSFVHGECVDEKSNIVGQFRKITNAKAINLAMGGNGPLIEFATLIEYGVKLMPKKVFWFYYEGNDLQSDLVRELKILNLTKYLDGNNNNLINKQKVIDEKNYNFLKTFFYEKEDIKKKDNLEKIKDLLKLKNIKSFLKDNFSYFETRKYKNLNNNEFTGQIYNINKNSFDKFEEIISKANKILKDNDAELYFVYVPEYWRYRYKSFKNADIKKNYNAKNLIIEMIDKNNIKIIDLDKDLFSKEENPLIYYPFGLYGHFNEKGYQLIAEFLKKKINMN